MGPGGVGVVVFAEGLGGACRLSSIGPFLPAGPGVLLSVCGLCSGGS